MNTNVIDRRFILIELFNEEYSTLVVQTSCMPPTKLLDEIAQDLSLQKSKGRILIDALLYSGNNQDRFISANFCRNHFDLKSFKYTKIEKNNDIRKKTSDCLRNQYMLLDHSILNSYQKKLILKGCSI